MRSDFSRRKFIAGLGVLAAAKTNLSAAPFQSLSKSATPRLGKSPFKIAVINDEISQDFGHACEVASQQFGMEWMELRSMWNKNVATLDANEIAEAQRLLKKNNLRVTDIASPLFKVDFRGAPESRLARSTISSTRTSPTISRDEVLDRAIELAKKFGTDRIRCFDFWRLDNQAPYRKAMNDQLRRLPKSFARSASFSFWKMNPPAIPRRSRIRQGPRRSTFTGFHAQLGPRECRHGRRDSVS